MKQKKDGIRMLQYFKPLKGSLIILTILTIIFCAISIVNPIVNANLLTSLTNFNIISSLKFTLFMILLSFIKVFIDYFINIIYIKNIKQKLILNIRKDMIKQVFNMEIFHFEKHSSGEFTNRIINDPETASTILSKKIFV